MRASAISPVPLRFRIECGPLNWRLRGLLAALVAIAAAAAPYKYSVVPSALSGLGFPVDLVVVSAAGVVSLFSGPLAGVAYAVSREASPLTYLAAIAAALILARREPLTPRLVSLLQSDSLPRPTGLAAAALAAAITGAPALPSGAAALYAGAAAALAPTMLESVILGFLGALHPAIAAGLGAYVAAAPECYRCEGLKLKGVKLVGVYRSGRGFSCASGDASLSAAHRPLLIVIGGHGVELARRLASALGAELVIAVGKEDYEEALRRASETRSTLILATTHLPDAVLPPAPARDTAVIIAGVRDPVYLERIARALRLDRRLIEIFASRPGLAIAYPGCHEEILLLEWGRTD